MRFPQSCRSSVSLCVVVSIGLGAGCSQSTPTGPTPTGSVVARSLNGVAGTASVASVWGSARGAAAAAVVAWDCFAGAAPGSCAAGRVSALAVLTGEAVTTAPTNLTRTVQGATVQFSWGAPPGSQPTSYVIEAGSTSGVSNIAVFDTGSAATGLTVNNVPPGTYFVRVRGRDAAGVGPASTEVTVVVSGSGTAPGNCQPRNLTAIAVGSDVALGWEEPSGAGSQCGTNRYLIEVGSAPGASNLAQVSTIGLIGSYTVSGVGPGTFYIRVRSQGPSMLSALSNELVLTITGATPPGTTIWAGLVANGEGETGNDDDCGLVRADVTATIVQSGSNISGIVRTVVRSASRGCQPLIGFTLANRLRAPLVVRSPTARGRFPSRRPAAAPSSETTPMAGSPAVPTMATTRRLGLLS